MNLRQISSIKDIPVLDLETGDLLGHITNWAIYPRDQRIVAWILNKNKFFRAPTAVVTADIAEYGPRMVVVRDRQSIIRPDEVVGLPELVTAKMTVIGFQATTIQGRILGIITDLVFDTISSQIQQYYVRPQSMAGFLQNDLILPASKVTRIESNRVVFYEDVETLPVMAPQEGIQTA